MGKGLVKSIQATHEMIAKNFVDTETHFRCAACDKKRPLQAEGADNFFTAKNEGKICLTCVRQRDQQAFEAGRITMRLVNSPAKGWCAVSQGGKMAFKLDLHPTGEAAMLSKPSFADRQNNHWKGRVYPGTGTAHFQRKSKAVGVSPAPTRAKKRGRKPSTAS